MWMCFPAQSLTIPVLMFSLLLRSVKKGNMREIKNSVCFEVMSFRMTSAKNKIQSAGRADDWNSEAVFLSFGLAKL